MGNKVHPNLFRFGINRDRSSRWFPFPRRQVIAQLKEEFAIRAMITNKLRRAMISGIEFERSGSALKIIIFTARPGVLIGRGGGGIEEIRKDIVAIFNKANKKAAPRDLKLEVQEVRNPDAHAALIAQSVAEQLEKRIPFPGVLQPTP